MPDPQGVRPLSLEELNIINEKVDRGEIKDLFDHVAFCRLLATIDQLRAQLGDAQAYARDWDNHGRAVVHDLDEAKVPCKITGDSIQNRVQWVIKRWQVERMLRLMMKDQIKMAMQLWDALDKEIVE